MKLLGLDINATRVRAVTGPEGGFASSFPMHASLHELPLALTVAHGTPQLGIEAMRLCRQKPYLVWENYLPGLLDPEARPLALSWHGVTLDRIQALELVFDTLSPFGAAHHGVAMALPAYLKPLQLQTLAKIADHAGLPLLGSVNGSLAIALGAFAEQPWTGTAVVLDIDDHALTVACVRESDSHAHVTELRTAPQLSLRRWKQRLLGALADVCVMQSRRDPRESAIAEQTLYEQLDGVMDGCRHGRPINVAFQGQHWFQNLILQPEEPAKLCSRMTGQLLHELDLLFDNSWPREPPSRLLVTAQVAQLPGVVAALEKALPAWSKPHQTISADHNGDDDFGTGLLQDDADAAGVKLRLLPAETAARGAHCLAAEFRKGHLPRSHVDQAAPLPAPQPLDAGPARLHFQGQEFLLRERAFTIGRQPECDLSVDKQRYPSVAPWHCEIIYDPVHYILRDRSKDGTWVNERQLSQPTTLHAGDWIRLGPDGPTLRYLGKAGVAASNLASA